MAMSTTGEWAPTILQHTFFVPLYHVTALNAEHTVNSKDIIKQRDKFFFIVT
jgi:hypothetical protein